MTKSARAFIGSNDVVVKTLIPAMQTAYGSGGTAGATSSGLDILAEIAKARLTSRQVGTINDGADLANEILDAKCTDLRVGVSQETQDEFDAVKALTRGVFEVRGDPATAAPALAFVSAAPDPGRKEDPPRWGVIPAAACSSTTYLCTWPPLSTAADAQKRYLIFGYPTTLTDTDLDGETAAITTALGSSNAVVVGMMPDIGDKSVFKVGVCISAFFFDVDGKPIGANLGLHQGSLLGSSTSPVCGFPAQTMLDTALPWYASVTHRAAEWLAPSRLFAQERSSDGDWVGPTGWSPITFAKITGAETSLEFVNIPKNGAVGVDFELQVLATSSNSHPVAGVSVTVALANNSGVPAGAEFTPASVLTGTTQEDGIAHLTQLAVNKAGGYTFVANGVLSGGAATNTTVSTQVLNIKNSKR